MRIAISGTHRVGKTTLAEALAERLPGYELVPEPYDLLVEDGHTFAADPSIEDFELQLERSLECVRDSGADVIFDRCPLDSLGYLIAHRDHEVFRLEEWMSRVREAVSRIDRIVFVPVEKPDRIPVPPSEAPFRAVVDSVLRDLILDDSCGLNIDVITAAGTTTDRLRRVMGHL